MLCRSAISFRYRSSFPSARVRTPQHTEVGERVQQRVDRVLLRALDVGDDLLRDAHRHAQHWLLVLRLYLRDLFSVGRKLLVERVDVRDLVGVSATLLYHLVLVLLEQLGAPLLCVHGAPHVLVLEVERAYLVRGSDQQVFLYSVFVLTALCGERRDMNECD